MISVILTVLPPVSSIIHHMKHVDSQDMYVYFCEFTESLADGDIVNFIHVQTFHEIFLS